MATNANNALPVTSNPPPGVPWEQIPEYIALTDWVIPAGGRITYLVPHPLGASPTDITSFLYGQANVTLNTWPEFMYMLTPTPEWKNARKNVKPDQKLDQHGRPMWERYPEIGKAAKPMLDYKGLPDTISTAEDWWFFDIWRRLHPQMKWEDILMRMEVPNRDKDWNRKFQNAVQNDAGRKWHKHYHMVAASWFGTGRGGPVAIARVHAALQAANIPIHLNTTRGIAPGPVDSRQPNGRHIDHPSLPARRYNPRIRPQRRRRTSIADQENNDGDMLVSIASIDSDDTHGEYGEGSLPSSIGTNLDQSPAPEDTIGSRLRSRHRRNSPPAPYSPPLGVPATLRKRTVPVSTPTQSKPREKRVAAHQIKKKLRPITFPARMTANLQAKMLKSGMSAEEFGSLVASTLAPIQQEDAPSTEPRSIRRQHRPSEPAPSLADGSYGSRNRRARRTVAAPLAPPTQPMGPPAMLSRGPASYPRADNGYNPPLSDHAEDAIPCRSSLQHSLQELPRAPTAPMYTPAAFAYGTAYATAQQFDFHSQYPLPSIPIGIYVPAPTQPTHYYVQRQSSSQQVPNGDALGRDTDDEPVDNHFNSDGMFREYEG